MNTMLLASIFSPEQLITTIVVASVVLLLIVANIILFYFLRRHRERKLCTTRLQAKRNELLNHLKDISDDGSVIEGSAIYADTDEIETEEDDAEETEEEDEEGPEVTTETVGEGEDITQNEILAVADMSFYTRRKLGFVGEEFDHKRY